MARETLELKESGGKNLETGNKLLDEEFLIDNFYAYAQKLEVGIEERE